MSKIGKKSASLRELRLNWEENSVKAKVDLKDSFIEYSAMKKIENESELVFSILEDQYKTLGIGKNFGF